MKSVSEVIDRYIAAWNETDAERRHELVTAAWTEDATYLDAHRSGQGHSGISLMIQKVQEQFPGYQFRLKSGVEDHNGRVRFQWEAGGTQDAPLHFVGTDFGMIAGDGRLESITGFVDEAPGLAAKR